MTDTADRIDTATPPAPRLVAEFSTQFGYGSPGHGPIKAGLKPARKSTGAERPIHAAFHRAMVAHDVITTWCVPDKDRWEITYRDGSFRVLTQKEAAALAEVIDPAPGAPIFDVGRPAFTVTGFGSCNPLKVTSKTPPARLSRSLLCAGCAGRGVEPMPTTVTLRKAPWTRPGPMVDSPVVLTRGDDGWLRCKHRSNDSAPTTKEENVTTYTVAEPPAPEPDYDLPDYITGDANAARDAGEPVRYDDDFEPEPTADVVPIRPEPAPEPVAAPTAASSVPDPAKVRAALDDWLAELVHEPKRDYAAAWIAHELEGAPAPADPGKPWAEKARKRAASIMRKAGRSA